MTWSGLLPTPMLMSEDLIEQAQPWLALGGLAPPSHLPVGGGERGGRRGRMGEIVPPWLSPHSGKLICSMRWWQGSRRVGLDGEGGGQNERAGPAPHLRGWSWRRPRLTNPATNQAHIQGSESLVSTPICTPQQPPIYELQGLMIGLVLQNRNCRIYFHDSRQQQNIQE